MVIFGGNEPPCFCVIKIGHKKGGKTMSKETIVYEIKLQPAVIVLLGVIALGVVGNVFKSVSPIQDAIAEWDSNRGSFTHPLHIEIRHKEGRY